METHDTPTTNPNWDELEERVESFCRRAEMGFHALLAAELDKSHEDIEDGR